LKMRQKGENMRLSRSSKIGITGIAVLLSLLALLVLASGARAGEYGCTACQSESGWSGAAKLDEIGNPNAGKTAEILPGMSTVQKSRVAKWGQTLHGFGEENNSTAANAADKAGVEVGSTAKKESTVSNDAPAARDSGQIIRSARARTMLVPIDNVSKSEILLDISEEATTHIPGSIVIPYTSFFNGSRLKPESERASILGNAGISRDDPLVIYGECMPCGGGPAPATYVYWMLRSMGQENVRVLDGNVEDWQAAGKETDIETAIMPAKTYAPSAIPDFAATYDYVKNADVQIVDARSPQEFGAGSIPNAVPIPYESVITGSRIKDESRLEKIFASLKKDQPVVIYTNTGLKGSVVWFALMMQGYEARLYSYEDWLSHQQASGNATNATD